MADTVPSMLRYPGAGPVLLVLVTAVIALAANVYGTIQGITIVVPHLLYLPVVFCAFFFPKRGVLFAVALSVIYLAITTILLPYDTLVLISAAARSVIVIIIAVIVSYLSASLKQREQSVRSAKEEWERTFDAIPDLIAIIDRDYRVLRVNRAMAKSVGISPDEAVGRHCYEIVHHTELPPSFCPHTLLLKEGTEHSSEVHEDTLGGDFIITTSPLFDEKGAVTGSVHIARDITAERQAQQKIRQLAAIVQYANDAIISEDLDGNVTTWNAGAKNIYGYTEDEIVGRHISTLTPPDRRDEIARILETVKRGDYLTHFDTVRTRKDGQQIQVSLTASPILASDGAVHGVSLIAEDITERKRLEHAIVQANKKLNILSSITRHDILNKITALYAYLDISRETCTSREQCETIDREIATTQALQRQVEFTRYYQDIGVQEPKWHNVGDVFRAAEAQLPLEGIRVDVSCKDLELYADPLIEKVFYNLLENSVRHGEHVTEIQVRAGKSDAGYSLVYEDNGAGVPKEIKGKLFQRGFGKHTGLGLFLSREILSITGITITENGEPGKGVRFEIDVPEGGYRVPKEPAG